MYPGVNLEGEWDNKRHLELLRSAFTQTKDLLERLEHPKFPYNEFALAWNSIMLMPDRLQEREVQ